MMTGADAKALQALEAMKSHHDFDSTVCLESLGSVRKRFSIPNEYVLHAPRSGQRPYNPYPGGFGISINALEAGLRFPLHPVIGVTVASVDPARRVRVCLRRAGDSHRGGQGCAIGFSETTGGGFCRPQEEGPIQIPSQGRQSHQGKGSVDTSVEPPSPRQKPKSVRELCSARVGVDGRGYHTIRMCNLPEQGSDAPLDPDLRPLTHGTSNQHYQTALFDRVHDAGRVITSLDGKMTLLRQELQDLKEGGNPDAMVAAEVRAAEAQSLAEHLRVELDKANDHQASVEADMEKARSGSANLERQLVDLRIQLGDSKGQL
ncbi:hypothetical protein BHE74_00023982 [Ensete ventricosum]|nr:hypothetical protein BHE74_00023982 [Ensete ventricosum]